MLVRTILILLPALFFSGPTHARDPFSVILTVDGQSGSRSFTSVSDVYDAISTNGLTGIVPSYTDASPATAEINLRGLAATASFAANSPALRIQIPSAGIDETFNGATRDESRRLFEDWLRGRGSSRASAVFAAAVRNTPIDPIAGNPNAALSQMVASDFNRALDASYGERSGFGLGARFGSFSAGGYRSNDLSLPLDYTWRISERDTLQIDVPFSYGTSGGATSYSGNLGVLYRRQVLPNWTLQGSLRLGGAGSVDLGSAAGIYGIGLNSTAQFDLAERWRLVVANTINYVSTFGISANGYSIDYNVSNTVFRNGVVLKYDTGVAVYRRPLLVSAFLVDTRFTGTAVYIRNYQEFGVFATLGREARGGVGLTMMTGDRGLLGVAFNMGVKF